MKDEVWKPKDGGRGVWEIMKWLYARGVENPRRATDAAAMRRRRVRRGGMGPFPGGLSDLDYFYKALVWQGRKMLRNENVAGVFLLAMILDKNLKLKMGSYRAGIPYALAQAGLEHLKDSLPGDDDEKQ